MAMQISGVTIQGGMNILPAGGSPSPSGPTDPNFSDVSLLLNGDGTNGSTSFPDLSSNGRTVTAVGDAQVDTAIKKFGTGSIKFDGTDDRLTCASSTDFEVGTGDFTIEGWAYNAGDKHSGLFQISGTSGGLQPNNTLNIAVGMRKGPVRWQMYTNGAYNDAASATWSPNTWYHFAMVRSSGVAKLYVDGTEVISVTDTNNYTGTNIVIGGYYSTGYLFDGYIDEFRVTKGVARYTSNFTAPTAAFPTS